MTRHNSGALPMLATTCKNDTVPFNFFEIDEEEE